MPRSASILLTLLLAATIGLAHAAGPVSETDYFSELPEVLTVTRLAQPLSETPGAVTIIDRETIRRSGAHEIVDLLRLVPGYLVGGENGAHPSAVYHAPLDDYGTRNLVLIDGRSVYSSFFVGDTHRGMMGVLLEDIERIEVLRGSNSAAFGANAMFGVINIVTRHAADTQGVEVSVTGGGGGIEDNYARIGWGDATASFRVTTGRRKDSGYRLAHDDKILSQLHFRGDLRPAADQELMLAAGFSQLASGEGVPGYYDHGKPERTADAHTYYLHGTWTRRLSETDEIRLSANFNEEMADDVFPYRISNNKNNPSFVLETLDISFSGRARRFDLEFQHQVGLAQQLRAVWGVGYKHEGAFSRPLYDRDSVSVHESRLFGNLEWRPHKQWLINAGGFWSDHSHMGTSFMPRLMANYHVVPDHTLRAGTTRSARMPSLYELFANRRYHPAIFGGVPLIYDLATGNVRPEILKTEELGYFGNFRDMNLTLDVRVFRERMTGTIDNHAYVLPGYVLRKVDDFINARDLETSGIEYQLRWKPLPGTEIWLNQNRQDYGWNDPGRKNNMPPRNLSSVALFQKLPHGFDLGIVHYMSGVMTWRDEARQLKEIRRTDVRLAYPFRTGVARGELAITVQAAGGDYVASYPYKEYPAMIQERRAFGTLRLEL